MWIAQTLVMLRKHASRLKLPLVMAVTLSAGTAGICWNPPAAFADAATQTPTPPPVMTMPIDPTSMAAARVGVLPDAPPGSVVLRGLAGQSETLTAADIAKLPHEQVSVEHGGKTMAYAGPALDDLLRDVGAPFGNKIHGQGVNDVLYITGRDKYRVVMTLPEIDSSFHKGSKVILADQADGKPLSEHDGPYRLVVDGDLKPSRSVYGVVLIEVKHLP